MLTAMSCAAFSSCVSARERIKESGNYVRKEIRVEHFDKMVLSGSPTVTFRQKSGKPRVEVYASDNLIDLLDIRVKKGTLMLGGFKENVSVSYGKLEVSIEAPSLESVVMAGASDFVVDGGLEAGDFNLVVSGNGDAVLNEVDCSGNMSVVVSGAGDVKLGQVHSSNLSAVMSGNGDAVLNEVDCSSDISVAVSGAGDVNLGQAQSHSFSTVVAGNGGFVARRVETVGLLATLSGAGTARLVGKAERAAYTVSGNGDLKAEDMVVGSVEATATGGGDIRCHATDKLRVRTAGNGSVGYKGNPKLDYPERDLYKIDD